MASALVVRSCNTRNSAFSDACLRASSTSQTAICQGSSKRPQTPCLASLVDFRHRVETSRVRDRSHHDELMDTGPNGNLFVVSVSHGAVYEVFRK
jgi:hypothetical protein